MSNLIPRSSTVKEGDIQYAQPVRNDSREFPGKAKFPGILEISQEILGNFAFFWCDRKFPRIPGNFWEHLQQYLTALIFEDSREFSRILRI